MNKRAERLPTIWQDQCFLEPWWLPPTLNMHATYRIRVAALYPCPSGKRMPILGGIWAHERYTGPEVHRVLGPDTSFLGVPLGSGRAIYGIGSYAQKHALRLRIVAGIPSPGPAQTRTGSWEDMTIRSVQVNAATVELGMQQLKDAHAPWRAGPMSVIGWKALEEYLRSLSPTLLMRMGGNAVGFLCLEHAT